MSPQAPGADSKASSPKASPDTSYLSVIDKTKEIIKFYGDLANNISDWDNFAKVIDSLVKRRSEDLEESLKCIKHASVLWMDGIEDIREAVRKVHDWCAISVQVLGVFLSCESGDRLNMVSDILQEGQTAFASAIPLLKNSAKKLFKAYSDMMALGATYEDKLARIGTDTGNAMARRRAEAYGGALLGVAPAASFFLPAVGPFLAVGLGIGGLVVSYSVAAGVVEGAQVPALRRTLEDAKKGYKDLLKTIEGTKSAIDYVIARSNTEIEEMGEAKSSVKATQIVARRTPEEVRGKVEELVEVCEDYMKNKKKWTKAI